MNEGSSEDDESVNAETGGVENVTMAATTAEQRESVVKVLETMTWPSSQLWDI